MTTKPQLKWEKHHKLPIFYAACFPDNEYGFGIRYIQNKAWLTVPYCIEHYQRSDYAEGTFEQMKLIAETYLAEHNDEIIVDILYHCDRNKDTLKVPISYYAQQVKDVEYIKELIKTRIEGSRYSSTDKLQALRACLEDSKALKS